MFEGFQRGQARIGDVDINYVTAGKGPPVLLLHGYPQNLAMWAHVAPILARNFTVVCGDLRGYGDSSKPTGNADEGSRPAPFRPWHSGPASRSRGWQGAGSWDGSRLSAVQFHV